VLAGVVAMLLTAAAPLVQPTFGLEVTIFALVGVVVGGMDNLVSATLGGFVMGVANSLLGDILPADLRVFLPSFTFLLVIIVLVLRPAGLFRARAAAEMERV
jgi:branched-chain amino acid transport system permease protein